MNHMFGQQCNVLDESSINDYRYVYQHDVWCFAMKWRGSSDINGLYTYILWLPTQKQANDNVGMIILGSYTVDLPNKKQDNSWWKCCWIFQGGLPTSYKWDSCTWPKINGQLGFFNPTYRSYFTPLIKIKGGPTLFVFLKKQRFPTKKR